MKKKIQKILTDSCILFAVLIFIVYGIGYCVLGQSVTMAMNGIAMLFAICVALCIFHKVLTYKKWPLPVRILLHYLLVLSAAYLSFAVIGKVVSTSPQSLAMLAIITLLYTVFALVYAFLGSKQKANAQEDYVSMFKK